MGSEKRAETPKKRKRLKRLCAQIRDQMEFYFSDANLSKDRYLRKIMDEDPEGFVDLSAFKNFHRLQQLTTDMTIVAKALSTSEYLEVSENKKRVKRKKPFVELSQEEIDKRTVYVECLPPDADMDWMREQFSLCGKVLYVSLPRYQSSGDLKGFAFVEFDSQEAAEKACMEMNHPPVDAPEQLGRFPKLNKQMKQLQKHTEVPFRPEFRERKSSSASESSVRRLSSDSIARRKRKYTNSESSIEGGDDLIDSKRRKHSSECSKVDSDEDQHERDSVKVYPGKERGKRKHKDSGSASDVEAGPSKSEGDSKRKRETVRSGAQSDSGSEQEEGKSRKRKLDAEDNDPEHSVYDKKAKKQDKETKQDGDEHGEGRPASCSKRVRISDAVEIKETVSEGKKKHRKRKKKFKTIEIAEFRVIPKMEWLQLRNEYLTLQKSSMTEIKRNLHKVNQQHSRSRQGEAGNQAQSGENKSESMDTTAAKENKPGRHLEFIPGVIVKVCHSEPFTRKEIKAKISRVGQVAYIDVRDGDSEGFIRCLDAENAKKIASSSKDGDFVFTLVTGEEEQVYWKKLKSDQEHKLNCKTKKKKRGIQKILDRVDRLATEQLIERKHVIFDA